MKTLQIILSDFHHNHGGISAWEKGKWFVCTTASRKMFMGKWPGFPTFDTKRFPCLWHSAHCSKSKQLEVSKGISKVLTFVMKQTVRNSAEVGYPHTKTSPKDRFQTSLLCSVQYQYTRFIVNVSEYSTVVCGSHLRMVFFASTH